MFGNLSNQLTNIAKTLSGRGAITEKNITEAMVDVRNALLEADVGFEVVKNFIGDVSKKAQGQQVIGSLSPSEAFVGIVRDELVELMGSGSTEISISSQPPAVILMAGLQGVGKTTTAAKLGYYLKSKKNKKVGVVSCDIYRPAAIEQLKIIAEQAGLEVVSVEGASSAEDRARQALEIARREFLEVLIVDTAGRTSVDNAMMKELSQIHNMINPIESIFVVDSMMGQDAVVSASEFGKAVPLTGIILSKTDGDARAGSALSALKITGAPIKFMGTGEKPGDLEVFHPERIASRILGMGDVLSLIEEVEDKVDKEKAKKLARKVQRGKGFGLEDFKEQLMQLENLGGMEGVLSKMPGMAQNQAITSKINSAVDVVAITAMIDSMTSKEKTFPSVIKASRKRRIASGSGRSIQDLNRLLKQFSQMQKMMKKMSGKGGIQKMMGMLGKLQ